MVCIEVNEYCSITDPTEWVILKAPLNKVSRYHPLANPSDKDSSNK